MQNKLHLDSSRTDVCNCLKELEKYYRFLQGINYFACSIAFQALQHNLLDLHTLTLFHLVSYDIHNRINLSLWEMSINHPWTTAQMYSPPKTAHTIME